MAMTEHGYDATDMFAAAYQHYRHGVDLLKNGIGPQTLQRAQAEFQLGLLALGLGQEADKSYDGRFDDE